MAFEIPDLDKTTYQQLFTHLRRRIPQYTSEWTDFNDSDPGITLLQLLAWIDESLLYQIDKIPLQTQQDFLRWVLGLAFTDNETAYSKAAEKQFDFAFMALREVLRQIEQGASLTLLDLQKNILSFLQEPYAALTLQDVAQLVMQTNLMIVQQQQDQPEKTDFYLVEKSFPLVRGDSICAYILADAKPRYTYPDYPNREQYLNSNRAKRKVAVWASGADNQKLNQLLQSVRDFLQPRILLGSQVKVLAALFTAVNVNLQITVVDGARLSVVLDNLFARLFRYFLPVGGGPENDGWQYDEQPDQQFVENLIKATPGVRAIEFLQLDFYPSIQLDNNAQLSVNTELAALPAAPPGNFYRGLPRLRVLDITARQAA